MIKAPDYNAKGTFSKFLLYFVSVVDLFFWLIQIVRLIIVKSVIVDCVLVGIWVGILVLAVYLSFYKLSNPFMLGVQIQIVYYIEGGNFVPFVLGQALPINPQRIL